MSEAADRTVTAWIRNLKRQDNEAARRLWERYFQRLVQVAGRKLRNAPRRVADEEDIAVGVFDTLCRGAAAGRFTELHNRDDLWRLLVAIAGQKAVDQVRRQMARKRGGSAVRGDSVFVSAGEDTPAGFEQLMGKEPTPEFIALLEEERQRLFGLLREDTQRAIARLRLEGYANEDIAENLGISLRTVERKLNLIREAWSQHAGERSK
jgi:RNA polymerase sigma factor (sigma-70 family)